MRLVSIGWVARRYAVAESTVRKMADRGELPHVRLSDNNRWFDADVIERLAPQFAKTEFVPRTAPPRRAVKPKPTPAALRPAAPPDGTARQA